MVPPVTPQRGMMLSSSPTSPLGWYMEVLPYSDDPVRTANRNARLENETEQSTRALKSWASYRKRLDHLEYLIYEIPNRQVGLRYVQWGEFLAARCVAQGAIRRMLLRNMSRVTSH